MGRAFPSSNHWEDTLDVWLKQRAADAARKKLERKLLLERVLQVEASLRLGREERAKQENETLLSHDGDDEEEIAAWRLQLEESGGLIQSPASDVLAESKSTHLREDVVPGGRPRPDLALHSKCHVVTKTRSDGSTGQAASANSYRSVKPVNTHHPHSANGPKTSKAKPEGESTGVFNRCCAGSANCVPEPVPQAAQAGSPVAMSLSAVDENSKKTTGTPLGRSWSQRSQSCHRPRAAHHRRRGHELSHASRDILNIPLSCIDVSPRKPSDTHGLTSQELNQLVDDMKYILED